MKFGRKLLLGAGLAASLLAPASAYETGSPGWLQKPGLTLGVGAGTPPPGLYMFNQAFTYQSNLSGPGTALINPTGTKTGLQISGEASGVVWVPGWSFLGATYSAVLVQPFIMADLGSPINAQSSGVHNTYVVPVELSWKLGDSGFFVKSGLGMYAPTGTVTGANGLGNIGMPWWTFQPELVVSYLKDGWNLTANLFYEMNTKSTVTQYKSGDVLHAELTATKTIGKWTFGPVAYYVGQVSDDTSSAFYGNAINVNRYGVWAAGALVGYDFGPATFNVWALDEISARASGGTPAAGVDSAVIGKGLSVFASLSFRLWAPDEPPTPKLPLFRK